MITLTSGCGASRGLQPSRGAETASERDHSRWRLGGARSGHADRRARRLQRGPHAAARAARTAPWSPRPPPERRRGAAGVGAGGAARGRGGSTTLVPGSVERLGRVRGRGAVGPARGAGTTSQVSISRSTARCRSAPGWPARPRWSARSRPPAAGAGRRGRAARRRRRASPLGRARGRGRDDLRRRADRRHGPGRVHARPGRATRCSSTAATARVEHVPLDLAAAGLALLVIDTNAPHRNADSAYADRRRACEAAARGARGVRACARSTTSTTRSGRLGDDEFAPAGAPRRDRDRPGGGGGRAARRRPGRRDRAAARSRPTRRCATTSRSPAPSSTSRWRTARRAGALGARMTGGGFGGSAIALVRRIRTEDRRAVTTAVDAAFRERQPAGTPSVPATALPSERDDASGRLAHRGGGPASRDLSWISQAWSRTCHTIRRTA